MIQLVETAQSRKAPIQRLADVISGYFTYGVMTLATLTFVVLVLCRSVPLARGDGCSPGRGP
jgi:cation transport ATPase